MLRPRIIPCLLLHDKGLVKTMNFKTPKYIGDPINAIRIFNEKVELSISTRESEVFRNNIVHLGITSMSAESKTNPGGYVVEKQSLEQFEISDERTTEEIAEMLRNHGLEVVWKDWENNWEPQAYK